MSEISKDSLKEILQQLECHFTWTLMKDDIDPDELEERIVQQIELLQSRSKVKNYNLLAFVKYLNEKKEEALENLKNAEEAVKIEYPEETEKESLVTWSNCAWVYYHMGKLPEAQSYIKKIETICERYGSAFPYKMESPQMYCEKGWALLKFGGNYYEKAKESFAKALEADPENPEFNCGYAITVYRLEDHYDRKSKELSLEPLKRAVRLRPDDAFVVPLLGLKLQEANKAEEGEKYVEEALKKHPDLPYVLRYAAKFYRKKGDVERSLVLLKKALNQSPNSGFLHHQMGLCYRIQYFKIKNSKCTQRSLQQMTELSGLCISHFKRVVEQKTKFFFAHVDLANMYAERKELQKADEMFQKAFAMKKKTCAEVQQLHFNYGRFQEYHKKSEPEAVKHYLAGLKIESDSVDRSKCKLKLRKLIEKRIQKGSAAAESFGILGFIHQLSGEKQQAIECYEKALRMDPENEDYLSSLMNLRLSL